MKKHTVMVSYNGSNNTRKIRCRCDLDKNANFIRNGNLVNRLDENKQVIETLYVIYEGEESIAKKMRGSLDLIYDGMNVVKLS